MSNGLSGLIEALRIFANYTDASSPTHCEHDVLFVLVKPEVVSDEDKKKLDELGFNPDDEFNCFSSYRYGSA